MKNIDRTYGEIIEYIASLSARINAIYDITPPVCIRFNQNGDVSGSAVAAYRISDMYIEVCIPHNYVLCCTKHRILLAIILIHEYCHYITSLGMKACERTLSAEEYQIDQSVRRADEQKNWTATKKLAKELGLWNKLFFNMAKDYAYTAALTY